MKTAQLERELQMSSLSPGDRLIIRTPAETYHLTVLSPATRQVLVSGGALFPVPINARLEGCAVGGALVRIGGIAVGCALELRTPNGVLLTDVVRSIGFVEQG